MVEFSAAAVVVFVVVVVGLPTELSESDSSPAEGTTFLTPRRRRVSVESCADMAVAGMRKQSVGLATESSSTTGIKNKNKKQERERASRELQESFKRASRESFKRELQESFKRELQESFKRE